MAREIKKIENDQSILNEGQITENGTLWMRFDQ